MLNKVILMGRLTADPELRRTQSDRAVTSFTLAVNRSFTKKGEQPQTDFIDCVAWGNTAEFVSRWFTKGLQVAVTGRLQVRPWEDKQGQKRRSTEVVVDEAFFADSKRESGSSGGGQPARSDSGSQTDAFPFDLGPEGDEYSDLEIDDVELPY